MTDFFDWLTATDSGAAAEHLAAQFRISPKEMRETTDALVPAFMLGIQRTMADPAAWARLTQSFASMTGGTTGPGVATASKEAGEAVMRGLFGPNLVQAIAQQASLLTGQAPDIITKMMPALGAMTFRSMLQMMAAIPTGNSQAYPTDPAGQAMAEAMRRSANAMEAFSRPAGAPTRTSPIPAMTEVFADALKGGFPWMALPSAGAGKVMPTDPLALFSTMMAAFLNEAPRPAAPSAHNAQTEERRQAAKRRNADTIPPSLADMVGNAQSLQAEYVREMMALFDRHRPSGQ